MNTIIIATTKGRLPYLSRTLESISKTGHQIVIAVDGPAPDVEAYLSEHQDMFDMLIPVEKDAGVYRNPAAPFNEAMKHVTGEKVVFLHDDCFFKDAKLIDALLAQCKPGEMSRGKVLAYDGTNNEPYENYRQDEMTIGGHLFAITVADFKRVGGFPERITTMITNELRCLIALAAFEGIKCNYLDEALCYHLRHTVADNRDFARRHNAKVIQQLVEEKADAKVRTVATTTRTNPNRPPIATTAKPN